MTESPLASHDGDEPSESCDWDPAYAARAVAGLREQLSAANVRAEALADDVERLHARVKLARALMDLAKLGRTEARDERDELRARLDGLGEEWGYRDHYGDRIEGFETEADVHAIAPWSKTIYRRVVGPWLAAGGTVSADALPILESGCIYPMPTRAEVHANWDDTKTIRMRDPEAQDAYVAAGGGFWADLNRRMRDPEFRNAYVETSLQIQAADDAANADATAAPAQPATQVARPNTERTNT